MGGKIGPQMAFDRRRPANSRRRRIAAVLATPVRLGQLGLDDVDADHVLRVERRQAGAPGSPARARCPASDSCFSRSMAPRRSSDLGGRPSLLGCSKEMAAPARECRRAARAAAAGGSARRSGGRTDPRGTGPGWISWRRSRWVAATMRTLARIGVRPPTVVYSPSCSTRSRRVCASGGMSPISSRNSVPPAACSKRPAARCDGAGEGALLVAEQLALDQFARDRRHVDGDERPVAALAVVVQRARHQLLAGAGFAGDHHREVGAHQRGPARGRSPASPASGRSAAGARLLGGCRRCAWSACRRRQRAARRPRSVR